MALPTNLRTDALRWFTPSGIVLGLNPTDAGATLDLERSDDDGAGNPDPATAIVRGGIPASQATFTDYLARDGQYRHYRYRQRRGALVSGWSDYVKATPVTLLDGAVGYPPVMPFVPTADTASIIKRSDADATPVASVVANLTDDGHGADTLRVYSGSTARVVAKGYQAGSAADGATVPFAEPFQGVPYIALVPNMVAQPSAAAWSAGYNSALRVYMELVPYNVTPNSFQLRARLRQKGSLVSQTANFTAPLTASTVGSTTGPASLSVGGAVSDNYTCRARLSITCTTASEYPAGSQSATVALESNDGTPSGWVERWRTTQTVSRSISGTTTRTYDLAPTVAVTNMGAGDQFRWRLVDDSASGGSVGSSSVTGNSGSNNDGNPGVSYQTATGESYATMTPDAGDVVAWTAIEVTA